MATLLTLQRVCVCGLSRYAHGYAPWDPGFRNLPLEKGSTLIMSRVAVTVYNTMFEFWHSRRPDITLLLLSSRVVSIIRQLLIDYRGEPPERSAAQGVACENASD